MKPETYIKINVIVGKLDLEDGIFVQAMAGKIESLQEKLKQAEDRLSDYSWDRNPDRSGGSFSDDEINRSRYGGW
jgi:hypothetical protein